MFNGDKKSLYNNMTVEDKKGAGGAKGAVGTPALRLRAYRRETCGSNLCTGLPINEDLEIGTGSGGAGGGGGGGGGGKGGGGK